MAVSAEKLIIEGSFEEYLEEHSGQSSKDGLKGNGSERLGRQKIL